MFFFTYLPQLAVLVFVNGPLAVVTTVLLILSESSTIVNVVSRNFFLQDALLDTFDGTLVSRNATGIVSEGRELKPGRDPIARLGKILKSPFQKYSPKALIRYVMYLPLNFIPGTVSTKPSAMSLANSFRDNSRRYRHFHCPSRSKPRKKCARPSMITSCVLCIRIADFPTVFSAEGVASIPTCSLA